MSYEVVVPPLPPTIELGTVRLRGLRSDDAAALLAYLGNPVVVEHTSYPVQDAASVEAFIEIFRRGYDGRRSCRWALARASDDVLIGTCGFNSWALAYASAELAYDMAPEYWGQGLMRQSVGAALEWAFDTAGFNRVQAVVMVSNLRSSGLLERLGFHQEGTLRSFRIARGVPRDFWMYSLLKAERAGAPPTT
jgi:[ribosomal protein S5]-alanine N-acetyltransferase